MSVSDPCILDRYRSGWGIAGTAFGREEFAASPRNDTKAMSDVPPLAPLNSESRLDQIFPTLNPDQVARISGHGAKRRFAPGDVVYQPGTAMTLLKVSAATTSPPTIGSVAPVATRTSAGMSEK